jgi:glycosyltransferase involved in cell wall biosynthesis
MEKCLAVITKYFYPVVAGIETNIMETYGILAQKNEAHVTVHTLNATYTTYCMLPKAEVVRNLKIRRYSAGHYYFMPKIDFNNISIICLHNFDVFPHVNIMLTALFLKLIFKKKFLLVLTPHGGFTPSWRNFPAWQRIIKYFYHYTLGVLLINLVVDKIRAVSEWEKEQMISKGLPRTKITVISNGIENEAYENIDLKASKKIITQVSQLKDYIIQIGRIYPIKNYETTIKAIANLNKHGIEINFVIAGPLVDEKYYQYLTSLIDQLQINDKIFFLETIGGIDKYYLIKHARLMVHMARWESFCNAVHEGLSQGLICIVARNTALPYLVKDNVRGFCVATEDEIELAKKIQFVLQNRSRVDLKNMTHGNKKFCLEASWEKVAEKMSRMYQIL